MENKNFAVRILCAYDGAQPSVRGGEIVRFERFAHGYYAEITDCGNRGAHDCVLTLRYNASGFSFKPCDVREGYPIYAPHIGVAVTTAEDGRLYDDIAKHIASFGLLTDRERFATEKQCSLSAAKKRPSRPCNTFLAVPGNVCIWNVGFRGEPIEEKQHYELYDWIIPRLNWDRRDFDADARRVTYRYMVGRGMGHRHRLHRRNSEGILPALCATIVENDVRYDSCMFCDSMQAHIEEDPGTPYIAADYHSAAHALTEAQLQAYAAAKGRIVPTVLRMKITATNTGASGRYAFFRLPDVNTPVMAESNKLPVRIENGIGYYRENVFMLSVTDGSPSRAQEFSVMLAPGESTVTEILLFHMPVEKEQAAVFHAEEFDERLLAAKRFWKEKAKRLMHWHLPEKAIDEAFKTGYMHLWESCYGERDSDTFAPCVGVYSPIGWESSHVIRFLDEIGDGETAQKCLNFFFAKQHDDGFMQNMVGYMLENGGVLYTAAKHYECTKDVVWLRDRREGIVKAAQYIVRWIERNDDERHGGRGMIDGQVADPVDPFRSYMLNAIAYAGLRGAAKMLRAIADDYASVADVAANGLQSAIIAAFRQSCILSPLVPLKNGTWVPAIPPWAEGAGATSLHLDGEIVVTHAAHILKDSLLSVPYLPYLDVFDCHAPESRVIIDYVTDLFTDENTGYSQPYYNVVPLCNLYRGEVNAFLREYYTAFATLADRETYSFWEHYFLATPHKTSEQASFLLRTLAMLFYERGQKLYLLHGVPEAWEKTGKYIEWRDAACAFGKFSACVRYGERQTTMQLQCDFDCDAAYIRCRGQVHCVRLHSGDNTFVFTE